VCTSFFVVIEAARVRICLDSCREAIT
jgi:hypothetical protein